MDPLGALVFSGLVLVGVVGGGRMLWRRKRAERNLQRLLGEVPGRDELATLILENPSSENILEGREMVAGVLGSLSRADRLEIGYGFYSDSITARARYVAAVITRGRSDYIRRIPSDERVVG